MGDRFVRARLLITAFGLFAIVGAPLTASAQGTQLPGLIVTMPPSDPEPAKPKAAPAPKRAAPAAKPRRTTRTKPKAKPRRRAKARSGNGRRGTRAPLKVSMRVNDDPITNYDITERSRLLAISANISGRARKRFQSMIKNPRTNKRLRAILNETIKANQGKSREQIIAIFERRKAAFAKRLQRDAMKSARSSVLPGLRKKAQDELVEERLKLQEAKRLGISIDKKRVNDVFANIAKRNKMTPKQFSAHLKRMGASARAMKNRFRAQLAWQMVVNRRFRRLTSVSERDIDQFLGDQTDADAGTRARLHKITLPVPKTLDQGAVARKMSDADGLRRRFRSCANTGQLAQGLAGAKFADLGSRSVDTLSEPTRSMVLSASDNQMLPPSLGAGGIELYAVCSKTAAKQSFEQRTAASRRIRQKEMDRLGRRHLANLRRDAHIERQ
ncbi:MAG: SurA N-terminal domain-containing protein [Pseudomonadota bacterium]